MPGAPHVELFLNGDTLAYEPASEYLGFNLSTQEVKDAATLERIVKAEARLRMLQRAKIRRPRIDSERLRKLYAALLQLLWTYGLQLTPFLTAVEDRATWLIEQVTAWEYPNLPKHSRKRERRLLALCDADIQRHKQAFYMFASLQRVCVKN